MRRLALRRPSALALATGPVLAVGIAFYIWTVATSASLDPGSFDDPYNRLVDGFSQGHLYLPIAPDPRLRTLPDPYEPQYNAAILDPSLRDLVYHRDRFYAYWGPVPALVAFWPFRALGLGDLPPGIAVLVFSIVGLLCLVALMLVLVRRHLPATPPWMLGVATAVLVFCSMAPWLLRRPNAYEVAISSAFCFFWAGLLLLATAFPSEGQRRWRMAAASLAFGLAFASRPNMGVGLVFALGALVLLRRAGRLPTRSDVARFSALLLGPAVVCIVAVATYNVARFGSPSDFGTAEMLAGSKQDKFFHLAYIPPNLWLYLLYPVRLVAAFPFFWVNDPNVPFPHTAAYDQAEKTAGLLPTVPFVALLALAPAALRGRAVALRRIVAAAAATGVFLVVFTSFFYWGSVMRYEADFAPLLILAAALVWFAFASSGLRRSIRRAGAATGAVLAGIAVVVCSAISLIGSDDRLRMLNPGTFASLERFFSPVSALFADAAGHPILAAVGGSPLAGSKSYDRLGVAPNVSFFLGTGPYPLLVVSGSRGQGTLEARVDRTPRTPKAKLVVQVHSPDGSIFSRPVTGGRMALPLSLRRGSNQITVQVFADRATLIPPYADSADDGALMVSDLRVRTSG